MDACKEFSTAPPPIGRRGCSVSAGYAENLDDGAVGVVAEGEESAIEKFIAWCRIGPPSARVRRIDITRTPPTGEFTDFEVR